MSEIEDGRARAEIAVDAPLERAAELEAEFVALGELHLALDAPSILEGAAKLNYRDSVGLKGRQDSEQRRKEIEARAAQVLEEHTTICKHHKTVEPLDRRAGPQLAALRSRLREAKMRRGRCLVLVKLQANKIVADHRLRALAEVQEQIRHLERVIQRVEDADRQSE